MGKNGSNGTASPAALTRIEVPLTVLEGTNRGTIARLARLQRNYLIRSWKGADGVERRLFLELDGRDLILWTAGRPDRVVTLECLLEAITSAGRGP